MLAILTAVAIGFLLSRKLSEPLALLAEGTKKIAKGNFKTRTRHHLVQPTRNEPECHL